MELSQLDQAEPVYNPTCNQIKSMYISLDIFRTLSYLSIFKTSLLKPQHVQVILKLNIQNYPINPYYNI